MSSAKWRPFCLSLNVLTQWGQCDAYSKHQWTKPSLVSAPSHFLKQCCFLLIKPLGTNFIESWHKIYQLTCKKMKLKVAAKHRPLCFSLNVLTFFTETLSVQMVSFARVTLNAEIPSAAKISIWADGWDCETVWTVKQSRYTSTCRAWRLRK